MIILRFLRFPIIPITLITLISPITQIFFCKYTLFIETIYLKLHFFVAQINILQHNKLRVACARQGVLNDKG